MKYLPSEPFFIATPSHMEAPFAAAAEAASSIATYAETGIAVHSTQPSMSAGTSATETAFLQNPVLPFISFVRPFICFYHYFGYSLPTRYLHEKRLFP